ncbi:glycosyltransferase family 4 protein [Aeromonas veronii]
MKKIIFYLPSLAPSGGIERIVCEIVNKLSNAYEITILVKDDCRTFYSVNANVKLHTLDNNLKLNVKSRFLRAFYIFKNYFSSVYKLKRYLRSHKYDYIYITHPLSQLELLCASVCQDKIIISEHGAFNNYNSIYRLIKRLAYKKCKFYCIPTTWDMSFYKKLNFPVIYTPHYKSKLNYSRSSIDNKVVLNIGRFTDDKKQLELLSLWSQIPIKDKVGWKLYIVGEGELVDQLELFITKHNLQSEVMILPPIADVERYYNQASIFALTSRSEGFGMVLLEAIGFGLPLISYDCPSGPRDIININNGFLIPTGADSIFKEKLIELMQDQVLRKKLSDGAYEAALNWSDDKITKIWEKVFK